MRVELHRGAQDDLAETAAVLSEEGLALADAFLTGALATIEGLAEFPQKGRLLEAGADDGVEFRAARLSRFPYKVVYAVRDDLILVLAVSHDRRRPRYWKGRF